MCIMAVYGCVPSLLLRSGKGSQPAKEHLLHGAQKELFGVASELQLGQKNVKFNHRTKLDDQGQNLSSEVFENM